MSLKKIEFWLQPQPACHALDLAGIEPEPGNANAVLYRLTISRGHGGQVQ